MIKTNYRIFKKLLGLATNNDLNINHKDLVVRISSSLKNNHEIRQLYLDICKKYNHSKPMKWKDLYKTLNSVADNITIEL